MFASSTSLLTTLIQRKVKFEWSKAYEKGFQKLKDKLTSAPIFTLPEGTDVFFCIL